MLTFYPVSEGRIVRKIRKRVYKRKGQPILPEINSTVRFISLVKWTREFQAVVKSQPTWYMSVRSDSKSFQIEKFTELDELLNLKGGQQNWASWLSDQS